MNALRIRRETWHSSINWRHLRALVVADAQAQLVWQCCYYRNQRMGRRFSLYMEIAAAGRILVGIRYISTGGQKQGWRC